MGNKQLKSSSCVTKIKAIVIGRRKPERLISALHVIWKIEYSLLVCLIPDKWAVSVK